MQKMFGATQSLVAEMGKTTHYYLPSNPPQIIFATIFVVRETKAVNDGDNLGVTDIAKDGDDATEVD